MGWLIVAFVLVTAALLVLQMAMDVMAVISATNLGGAQVEIEATQSFTPGANYTPVEPSPTFDISDVEIKDA